MSPGRRGQALDDVLGIATPVLEFAESALDLVPIPGLSLVAKGLGVIVDRVKDARANDDARLAFTDEVKALDAILMEMVTKTKSAVDDVDGDEKKALVDGIKHSEALQSRVQILLSTIEELREHTKDLKGGPGARGFVRGFIYSSRNEATLSDMKERLASAIRICKLQGQMSIEDVLGDVIQDAKEIRQALRKSEDDNILNSILRAPAGYRSVDELKSEFLDGTRQELFDELTLWSAGKFPPNNPKPFYFLSGGAGLGKSSIAHELCRRLDPQIEPSLGASFFFLAHQLALSQPTLFPHIISAARQHLNRGDRQQMKYTFEDLLRQHLASDITQKPFVIIIDGLDECKERDLVPELLRLLLGLVRELPWVRVFVASRPEPRIQLVLTSTDAADVVHRRSLEDTLVEWGDDIGRYLTETIPKMSPYDVFVRDHPIFLKRLIARARGVFIFARVAVGFLDTYRDHPQEQFELLLSSGGEGLSPLDAIYLQVLSSAFPPTDLRASSTRHTRLQSFLTICALQQLRPLTLDAMALLARLTKDDIVGMTDQLRSVLLIDKKDSVVALHATFFEFLLDPDRCRNPLYHITQSKGHVQLASACFASFTFENVPSVLIGGHLHSYIFYSHHMWGTHLKEADFDDKLKEQLMCFINTQIPIHTRLTLDLGPPPFNDIPAKIQKWLKSSEDATEISLEYAKSFAYSVLWWRSMCSMFDQQNRRMELVSPDINADDIRLEMMESLEEMDTSGLDLTVEGSDIARYQAAHEELAKRIRDAGLEEVWFDPEN
ncbi:hypothetical protein B0H17DRAFT_1034619 [Mycena rosella]|uniref:NACHT domain-containing protein n=1 Tax=Mycena rosella TaxID=1033263 RepID=A0AAD7GWN8_MYCRO|nr:hypothetical protein B0H17DRAFT_1034619 [Mycena rosella]